MIQVTVNAQRSEARLTITPDPETKQVTADQMVAALKQSKVVYGISRKQLFALRDRFNQNPTREISAVVARSRPAEASIQPSCNFYFQRQRQSSQLAENDQIDYKDKGITRYFEPGSPLIEIFPGRLGRLGHLVDGSTITPQPLEPLPRYKAGPGVEIEDNPDKIVYRARIAGQARLIQDTVSISETLEHDGDVDMETGHIEFAGPVAINGSLGAGFHIFSNSDISIAKTVSGTIKTRGNLKIGGGLIGGEEEQVMVGGRLACEYISASVALHVGGTIQVGKHIINSTLICDDKVFCEGSISGECRIAAFLGLSCGELGSEQGSRVVVKLGNFVKLKEKLCKIDEYLEPLINESIAMVDQVGLQVLMQKDVSGLPPEKQPEATKILERYLEIDGHVNRLKEKKNQIEKRIAEGIASRAIVRDYAHPGNIITIGLENYTIKTGLSGPLEFYFDQCRKTITFERIS